MCGFLSLYLALKPLWAKPSLTTKKIEVELFSLYTSIVGDVYWCGMVGIGNIEDVSNAQQERELK